MSLLSKDDLRLTKREFIAKLLKLLFSNQINRDQYNQAVSWHRKHQLSHLTESEIKDLFNSPYPNNPDNSKH